MKRFAFAAPSIVLGSLFIVAACGGKVVVDGAPGHGGATSSSNSNTTFNSSSTLSETSTGDVNPVGTSVTSTAISGTSTATSMDSTGFVASSSFASSSADVQPCDCNIVCNIFAGCGLGMSTCQSLCQQASSSQLMCLCGASTCNDALGCIQGTTGGTFASAVSSGSGMGGASPGGEHPPKVCRDCINNEAQTDCQTQTALCENDPACDQIRQCHHDCGYGGSCTTQCGDDPSSVAFQEYTDLIQCADCQFCPMECANTAISSEFCIFNTSSATAP